MVNTTFYPSDHPFTAIDDPALPAHRLELEEEKYPRLEDPETDDPPGQADSADGRYIHEAGGLESGTPPRRRPRTHSPPLPEGIPMKKGGGGRMTRGREAVMIAECRKACAASRNWTLPRMLMVLLTSTNLSDSPWLCLQDDSVQVQ